MRRLVLLEELCPLSYGSFCRREALGAVAGTSHHVPSGADEASDVKWTASHHGAM
jgi:hypothetical protein